MCVTNLSMTLLNNRLVIDLFLGLQFHHTFASILLVKKTSVYCVQPFLILLMNNEIGEMLLPFSIKKLKTCFQKVFLLCFSAKKEGTLWGRLLIDLPAVEIEIHDNSVCKV